MPEKVSPSPTELSPAIRETVSVHTSKIFDSCKDKDCLEDLRVYLTEASQAAVESAMTVRARIADLVYVSTTVEPVQFNRGYYTVDLVFYYRIYGEAGSLGSGAVPITGLSVFSKRVLLYGSEGSAKIFRSDSVPAQAELLPGGLTPPVCVVEALDPIVLDTKVVDANCQDPSENELFEVPQAIAALFDGGLVLNGDVRRTYVTLGQFSIVRLERDAQLIIPAYDYCVPEKACVGADGDDPCTLFGRIEFPVEEFFPPDTVASYTDTYRGALETAAQ